MGTASTAPGYRLAGAFDPAQVAAKLVGTARLTFSGASTGRLDYTVEGSSGSKAIARLPVE